MKLKDFPWLSEELFSVTSIDSTDVLSEANEVTLYRDDMGDWFVSQNEIACRVEFGRQSAELELHGQRDETTWLLTKITDKTLLLQFVGFIEKIPLDLTIGITEKQAEELTKKGEITSPDVALAVNWFTENFLMAKSEQESSQLVIAHFDNAAKDQFLCIGRRWQATVQRQPDGLIVQRLNRQTQRPPMSIIEGSIKFQDASVAQQLLSPVQQKLLDAAIRSNGNYLELWQLYNKKEWSKALEKASNLGALRYVTATAIDGEKLAWSFTPESEDKLNEFRKNWRNLESQEVKVETTEEAPEWSSDEELNGSRGSDIFRGKLSFEGKEITIYPDEKRRNQRPPEKGYIAYSLAGEAAVKRRREDAKKSIDSGNRLPQLSHLLQGVSVSIPSKRKIKAMSPYARESFQGTPTDRQEDAIYRALNTTDITLIIGPPGTGKTQVIAALQRRLAEENNTPNIQHQVLVSSFQHDAVDNALTRSDVYGLPAIKVGGRNNKDHDLQPIKLWCDNRREVISETLNERREKEPHVSIIESLQQCFLELKLFSLSPSLRFEKVNAISTYLDELDSMGIYIPSIARDDWDNYCIQLDLFSGSRKEQAVTDKSLLRKIRALRTTTDSYDDDGADRAYDLSLHLKRTKSSITSDDQQILDQLSDQDSLTEEECSLASDLKNRLLDQQLPDYRPPELRNQLNETGRKAVSKLESALSNTLAESKEGIVGVLQQYHNALAFDPKAAERAVENYTAIVGATCQQAGSKKMANLHSLNDLNAQNDIEFQTVIIDEAARANPLDLFVPMSMAKHRIILVGDDRQLPHLLEPELEQELSQQENLSKLQRQAYSESLFERLRKQMLEIEKNGGSKRVVMLDTQFRMHPLLGDFVSKNFYESDGLDPIKSGRPAEDFTHEVPGYRDCICGWLNVPISEGKEFRRNHSPHRPSEAAVVAKEAKRLLDQTSNDLSIGVITFYSAQRNDIQDELEKLKVFEEGEIVPEYRYTTSGEERIRVGTVDAFQGKEFDVVLLSIVRANTQRIPDKNDDKDSNTKREAMLNRKYGHLRLSNRLNVAMSRQRKLLIAVGAMNMVNTTEAKDAIPALSNFLTMCGGENGSIR